MGTSDQMDFGPPAIKRFASLFSKGKPDTVIEFNDVWKSKNPVRNSSIKTYKTHERLFVAANNVEREPQDGCMKKIKIERSMKLRNEEFKNRSKYDIVTGVEQGDQKWIDSFGKQAVTSGYKSSMTTKHNDANIRDHWAKTLNMPLAQTSGMQGRALSNLR